MCHFFDHALRVRNRSSGRSGTEAAKLRAPANATDCHHHIYDVKFPADPKATLRPADALVEDYRALDPRA